MKVLRWVLILAGLLVVGVTWLAFNRGIIDVRVAATINTVLAAGAIALALADKFFRRR